MNCWHCGHELIWGGDHDLEDEEEYSMVTNLSCPQCHCHVDVYFPREKSAEDSNIHIIPDNDNRH